MLNIPAGRLLVGEGSAIKSPMDDQSQKWTNISEFAIGKFEITYREWNSIMGSNPKTTSSCGDDCPVVGITWDEAKEFVKALSERTGERYRLPSEVEWEYSARAGTDTAYFWGNSFDPRYANRGKTISPVGCYPSNRYGLFDMHGNASEFVEDAWSDSFSGRPKDRMARSVPTITSRPNRVLKGGSIERPPEYLWSISREEVYTKGDFSGLRVARDPFISFLTYDAVSQSQSAQQNDSESMHGASLSAIYVRKLVAAIRPKIVFNGMLHGNPAAEVEVLAQPNGKITSRRITKSSGRQDWDNAVLLAIDRLRTLPTDANGQAPTKIYLIFRPSEM
jgi:TonB family protein